MRNSKIIIVMMFIAVVCSFTHQKYRIFDFAEKQYSQDVASYIKNLKLAKNTSLISLENHKKEYEDYLDKFLRPFSDKVVAALTYEQAFKSYDDYKDQIIYRENYKVWNKKDFDEILQNQAAPEVDIYPAKLEPAIIVANTNVRVLPTNKPVFLNPEKAGEGYPFDYLQNSSITIGSPVLITNVSSDKMWYFIDSSFVAGWVRSSTVAFINKDKLEQFKNIYNKNTQWVSITKDGTPLSFGANDIENANIGTIFPVRNDKIYVPVKNKNGFAELVKVELNKDAMIAMPLKLTAANVTKIADEMIGNPYGWGGVLQNRDCSSTMRDVFSVFGMYLPRNSFDQINYNELNIRKYFDMSNLTTTEKKSLIKEKAVPFATLLWKRGHIGLYIGTNSEGEPMMYHAVWGIKTRNIFGSEGRAVIGKTVITDLHPKENRLDVTTNSFLDSIDAMMILGG